MNDDRFGGELHAWIEPELEARLVALILGEASDFEAEELERMMRERPELRVFKRRLEVVHSLLGEAVRPPDADKWRMVPERRAALMETLGIEPAKEPAVVPIDAGRERRVRRAGLKVAVMAAACFLISLVLAPFLFVKTKKISGLAETAMPGSGSVRYAAHESDEASLAAVRSGYAVRPMNGPVSGDGRNSVRSQLAALKQNLGTGVVGTDDGLVDGVTVTGGVFRAGAQADGSINLERLARRRGGGLTVKSAPGSSTAKVVGSAGPAPLEIPVPEVEIPGSSVEFGSGESFGHGWGFAGADGNGKVAATTAPVPAESASPKPVGKLAVNPIFIQTGDKPNLDWSAGVTFQDGEDARGGSGGGGNGRVSGQRSEPAKRPVEIAGDPQPEAPAKPPAPATPQPKRQAEAAVLAEKGREHQARANAERETRRARELQSEVERRDELAAEAEPMTKEKVAKAERSEHAADPFAEERPLDRDGREDDRQLAIRTKHVEAKQANTEELNMDWVVEDSSKKVDANNTDANNTDAGSGVIVDALVKTRNSADFIPEGAWKKVEGVPAVEGANVNGVVPDGLRSGDAAITRNSIDAILNNPVRSKDQPDASGFLSIPGRPGEVQRKLIERGLEQAGRNMDGVDVSNPGEGVMAEGVMDVAKGGLKKGLGSLADSDDREEGIEGGIQDGSANNYIWRGSVSGKKRRDVDADPIAYESRVGDAVRGPGADDRAHMAWFSDHETKRNRDRGEKTAEAVDDPARTNPAANSGHADAVDKVRKDLYMGEGYYNLGKLEEARKHFDEVLKTDPYHKAARQWKERVRNARSDYYRAAYDETRAKLLMEVDEAWEQAAAPEAGGNKTGSHLAGGQASMTNKLDAIVIPKIDFENTTVKEAMDFLRQRTRELDPTELDPERKGINMVLRKSRVESGAGVDAELDAETGLGGVDAGEMTLGDLQMENVTLREALQAIGEKAGLQYKVDDYAVTMVPQGSGEGDPMMTRRWKVPPTFVSDISGRGVDAADVDPFAPDAAGSGLVARRPAIDILRDAGIDLPEGATATYLPGSSTLVVKGTPGQLGMIDSLVNATVNSPAESVDYMGLYEPPLDPGQAEPDPADEEVFQKLQNTIIPVVDFEDVTVEEALEFLRQRSRELDRVSQVDPGVDFTVRKPQADVVPSGLDAELLDEAGLGRAEFGDGRVKELKLRNVPLSVVLQYVGDQVGMRYEVQNGRVVMMPLAGAEGEEARVRSWKLHQDVVERLEKNMLAHASDPNDPFASAEDNVRHSLAQMNLGRSDLEAMFKDAGIPFPEGTNVIYLPETQTLVVKNTPGNLDMVDLLVEQTARQLATERQAVKTNEKHASQDAFSTFSLHVSDVSFKLAQAALAKGEWPDAERIRVEEFANAFDYGDPAPSQDDKVACALDQAAHPFMQQRNMLRIAMRTAAVGRSAGTPLRLTVLLDNSGSMERSDRAESVQRAFELLAAQMNPQDEVTLISFARQSRLVRDSVPGNKVGELVRIIRDTPSEGGTNLEEALRLGVEKAKEDYLEGAQNRIILLTDGAANLGNAEPELLGEMVEQMRQQGIAFDACGVGADGLNDDVLEALTRKGDGRYYFLDRPEDADAGFAKQIAGALRPAAKNVKVQVEFNPKRVGHYRLYGFEKHELKKEDFRDDRVDAAEMAAEEAGVAIYQVETLPDGEGDVGSVSVRFLDMASGEMVEKRWTIPYEANPARLDEAAPSMQLAASAAFLGEKLKGTPVGELVELGELSAVSRSLQPVYPADVRVGQLVEMIEKARAMGR